MVKVGIVMGSISDKPVMEECEKMLQSFNIEYEVKILSNNSFSIKNLKTYYYYYMKTQKLCFDLN